MFSDHLALVTDALHEAGLDHEIEHKRFVKYGEERIFTHIHVRDRYNHELTLYAENLAHYAFKSSITGKAIERLSIAELEDLLKREEPNFNVDAEIERLDDHIDRFELFRMLLQPLEGVKQNAKYHPEGDALYHSLQVFEQARNELAYDEEFLLAALLHDVGKAIDPTDHVGAGLQALDGAITERTKWLIEHHMEAHQYRDGTLGARARIRLQNSEFFEDVMLLEELDKKGRMRGVMVCELEEALEYIRDLEDSDFEG